MPDWRMSDARMAFKTMEDARMDVRSIILHTGHFLQQRMCDYLRIFERESDIQAGTLRFFHSRELILAINEWEDLQEIIGRTDDDFRKWRMWMSKSIDLLSEPEPEPD